MIQKSRLKSTIICRKFNKLFKQIIAYSKVNKGEVKIVKIAIN